MYHVYILATRYRGTLYIGVTNDLLRRIYEHQYGLLPGFTKQYGIHNLVYFETHEDVAEAIRREKLLKRWRRPMKFELIEAENPNWFDLYPTLSH